MSQCNCNCNICKSIFKVGDVVKLINQWGNKDIGIIVKIENYEAIVSMKKFQGDYCLFPLNDPDKRQVKKLDIDKETIIKSFGSWLFDDYNLL